MTPAPPHPPAKAEVDQSMSDETDQSAGAAPEGTKHFEYEGDDWQELAELIVSIDN